MKILLTFDTGYSKHAAAVIESIIQNSAHRLDFAVIYYDLDSDVQTQLFAHFEKKVNSLVFYKVDEKALRETITTTFSAEHLRGFNTYLRLFAPAVLNQDSYVVYLDCDTIIQGDICEITSQADLTKPVCAAVEYDPAYKYRSLSHLRTLEVPFTDPFIYEAYWHRTYRSLELGQSARYFNAGVLIMNLDYWRENRISEKALAFLASSPEKAFSADQDALNHVINGNIGVLHPTWNSYVVFSGVMSNYSYWDLTEAHQKPMIIHVAGGLKPWHYLCLPKYRSLYNRYRASTPWPEVDTDKNIRKIALRTLHFLLGKKFTDKVIGLVSENVFGKPRNNFFDLARKDLL